jgi:PAS domain S-box-containing protein
MHIANELAESVLLGLGIDQEPRAVLLASSLEGPAVDSAFLDRHAELTRANEVLRAEIAERLRAEEGRRESEERFRALVETTHEWIWSIDRDGRYTYSNPAVTAMLGYTPPELIGRNFMEFMHEADRETVEFMFPMIVADKWGWKDLIIRWRHKDGTYRYLERNATPILDAKGELAGYRGSDRDITERRQAEELLREERAQLARRVEERTAELTTANRQLAKAARLKDEFLASMSHELRTPLNSILGLSEVLQEEVYGSLNQKQMRSLHTIEESGRHLLSLINDILDLSKIEAGKVQLIFDTVSVESVCLASLRLVKEAAQKKRLKVVQSVDSQIATVWADERRLKQILVNLLGNAVKFTPEGGTVGLEVRSLPGGHQLTFAVWDTGIGIAPENFDRLFQPFVQLDSRLARQFGGTGLGLALVKRMVEMQGGTISVQSEVGRGSRFMFSLRTTHEQPTEQASSAHAPPPVPTRSGSQPQGATRPSAADGTTPPGPGPVILLAEDNEINVESMSAFLTAQGYQVRVATDGDAVLELARECRPNLILMDVQMPGMDGLEVTRHLRSDAELAQTPIIAVTALAMSGDRDRCLAAGATDYLSKPLRLRELAQRIEAHLPRAKTNTPGAPEGGTRR